MAIRSQFDTTVSTQRLTAVAESNRETWQTVLASLACVIHPNSGEHSEMTGGAYYTTHKMFCDVGTDIKIGDKVVVGGSTYMVKSVESYSFGRTTGNQHMRIGLLKGV